MEDSNTKVYKTSKIVFGDQKYADVEFVFEGGEHPEIIYAHSFVLRIECPKLYEKFILGKTYGACTIIMDDVTNAEVLTVFLELIYLGHSDNQMKFYDDLLKLSREFDIPNLLRTFPKSIVTFTLDNVFAALQASIDFQNDEMMENALDFISENYTKVLNCNQILNVSNEVFAEVLNIDNIWCDEYNGEEKNMADAVMRYIDANGDPNLSGLDKSQPFHDLIKLVRFPSMTPKQFSDCIQCHKYLLNKDEIISIFKIFADGVNQSLFFDIDRPKHIILSQVDNRRQIYVDIVNGNINLIKKKNGLLPTTVTIFSIWGEPVVLTRVTICKSSSNDYFNRINPYIFGQINLGINNKNKVLANIQINQANNRDYVMKPLIVLYPERKYSLTIDYSSNKMMEFAYIPNDTPDVPTLFEKNSTTIQFDQLNPIIQSLMFNSVKP